MLHFTAHKLVFLEVPKTATSSIVEECLSRSPELVRNRLYLTSDKFYDLDTHATSRDIRSLLDSSQSDVKIFAFIRNPLELICSKYSFYRSGRAYHQLLDPAFHASPRHKMNVLLARALPLIVYALLIPYKSSSHFILDPKGKVNVDILFDYAIVDHACSTIFTQMYGIYEDFRLPFANQSNSSSYLRNSLLKYLLGIVAKTRLRRDYALWKKVESSQGMLIVDGNSK